MAKGQRGFTMAAVLVAMLILALATQSVMTYVSQQDLREREADLLRFGLGEIEAVSPASGEDASLAAEESRLGFADTLRNAAEQARDCLSSEDGGPDALSAVSAARKLLDSVRDHDHEVAGLADRLAEVS